MAVNTLPLYYYYYYYYYYYHHHHHHYHHHHRHAHHYHHRYGKRQDSIVGIVIMLRAGRSGVLLQAGAREFFFVSLLIQSGSVQLTSV